MEKIIKELSEKLDSTAPELSKLDSYWDGTQPAAYLSKDARDALGTTLTGLSVNFPKLAVTSLAERLEVRGFREAGSSEATDTGLWSTWRRCYMLDASAQAHMDALVYGRSFVIVWANENGPLVTVESPKQVAVKHDPATRTVIAAFKRWATDGQAQGVLYEADKITRLVSSSNVVDGSGFPSTGWQTVEVIPNPFSVVPVVPLVNRGRLLDLDGISEMTDILGLTDALNKLLSDSLVSSEFYARPRRWATGLELQEDEDGNVIQPFSNEANKVWVSESEGTKFGQFDGARLDGYSDLIATVTNQIGALSGLPPHYIGINSSQPPSADAIRSAEASLVSKANSLQRTFGQAWANVAALIKSAETGEDPLGYDFEPVWASEETRTTAQATDAAVKLHSIGVPLPAILSEALGWTPEQVSLVSAPALPVTNN
ncbi:phage portal protein [Glutamicibacter sp. M10]|uniref:phage portal protein n=1 Tax=Glutamicibacter sp. M10 TaxID=3023076 RepID=UPI0021CA2E66|nr:phage portal protein [Glutamicibacter sp. M10]UXN30690.1 phage portal protein [Glutamicibacter sp. M10]